MKSVVTVLSLLTISFSTHAEAQLLETLYMKNVEVIGGLIRSNCSPDAPVYCRDTKGVKVSDTRRASVADDDRIIGEFEAQLVKRKELVADWERQLADIKNGVPRPFRVENGLQEILPTEEEIKGWIEREKERPRDPLTIAYLEHAIDAYRDRTAFDYDYWSAVGKRAKTENQFEAGMLGNNPLSRVWVSGTTTGSVFNIRYDSSMKLNMIIETFHQGNGAGESMAAECSQVRVGATLSNEIHCDLPNSRGYLRFKVKPGKYLP